MFRQTSIFVFLIIAYAAISLTACSGQPNNNEAQDNLTRGGYTLVPDVSGEMGIDISTSFTLTTPHKMLDAMPTMLIDGQPLPVVIRQNEYTFLVTPAMPLSHNNLYIFRLERDELPDITWAFQTAVQFQIISTLPEHQSTRVPVDTGIEIAFSVRGETNISDHFSIYPHVEGRFIHRGATAVFMPTSPLEHRQLYTVTIEAGVGLANEGDVISDDRIFAFETEAEPAEGHSQSWLNSVSFLSNFEELPSFEPPNVRFWVNYDRQAVVRPAVHISVYRLDDRDQAIDAVRQLRELPRWANFSRGEGLVETAGLDSLASFEITERQGQSHTETLVLPDVLPPGFYLIDAAVDGLSDQMIVQISDLAVQIISDAEKAIVWVNDMTTGLPALGAQVYDHANSYSFQTDENGIAIVQRGENVFEQLSVRAADGKEVELVFSGVNESRARWPNEPTVDDGYWTVLQLDRTLFQRDDTLYFWGFAQNRYHDEELRHLTATLVQGWSWNLNARDILYRQIVTVREGSYSGEIDLPNLNPGSYRLIISHGDTTLGSIHFRVEDFVKPPYQLLVSADRPAAFVGESVTFTAGVEFFEGTPVSELEIDYEFWGWQLQSERGQGVTNLNGVVEVSIAEIVPDDEREYAQGQTDLQFSAWATLPEIGWTRVEERVRVFINDIDVTAHASREGKDASLAIAVHGVTLDRLNDGSAQHSGDFLDAPVSGQVVSVEVVRIYWEPVRDGEFYCFIKRRVVPRYRHQHREEVINSFEMTTGQNGEANIDFVVPNRENESYRARLTTIDGNGRTITQDVFVGRNFASFFQRANDPLPYLHAERWNYDIGDLVELSIKQGAELLTSGNSLFVVASNGILDFQAGSNVRSFAFAEEHLPNATVYAFHFNGHTYHSMSRNLSFNIGSRELILDVTTDQESYRPGDTVGVTITATDGDGNPKSANINLSVVDEALFALRDYTVNTRTLLYRSVSSGIRIRRATHRTFVSAGFESDGSLPVDPDVPDLGGAAAPATGGGGEDASATPIREDFEDAAVFASIRTSTRGEARFSFRLPDNITSWRLTTSGITTDLYAGNDVQNIIVTNPMFLHYSLNDIFLVGDRPTLGVNVYGTGLSGGERINFEVWSADAPDRILRASGASFERVNIPLPEITQEGEHTLIIIATADNGLSDAVKHSYRVITSHRQVDTAVFYDVTADTVFEVGVQGLTSITFTDRGRGQFLHELLGMRHVRGARLEGFVLYNEATQLIEKHFPETEMFVRADSFNPREYQREDGGLAMLPYAASDLALTVMLMPFITDELNINALRDYLYYMYEESPVGNRMQALYGLAMMREPVLLDLQSFAIVEDLPVRDFAYIALGFAAIGETGAAAAIFDERIAPKIQRIEPYYRVYTGSRHGEILEATSVVALLAAELGIPEALGLHGYVARNHSDDLLISVGRLAFISHEIAQKSDSAASITYTLFGERMTRDLADGGSFTLQIPAQNLGEFNLVSVTGDVSAISLHRTQLEEIEIVDNDITVTRQFFREGRVVGTNTFEQGDLVRVQISIDYSAKAIIGSYMVTDFLPAGLVPVSGSLRFAADGNTARWRHATIEGQRIIFFDHHSRFDDVRVYYYYARVVNPGTFKAEGTIVQNLGVREYLAVGEDAMVVIQG